MIAALADSTKDPLAVRKLEECDEAMALASGLSLEAQAASATVTPGSNLRVNITAIRRSPAPVTLTGVKLTGMEGAPALNLEPVVLADNLPSNYTLNVHVPDNQPYSQPYWLEEPKDGNLYAVKDQRDDRPGGESAGARGALHGEDRGRGDVADPAGAESLHRPGVRRFDPASGGGSSRGGGFRGAVAGVRRYAAAQD